MNSYYNRMNIKQDYKKAIQYFELAPEKNKPHDIIYNLSFN